MRVVIYNHPEKKDYLLLKVMDYERVVATRLLKASRLPLLSDFKIGKLWFRRQKDGVIVETSGPGTPLPFMHLP